MISKNELRLGNLVVLAHESNAPIAKIWSVNHYSALVTIKNDDTPKYIELDNLMPIELNEQWLERLGGEKDYDGNIRFYFDPMMCLWFNKGNPDQMDLIQYGGRISFKHRHLPFVHSFQNFMYALTQKELTIKEPINE